MRKSRAAARANLLLGTTVARVGQQVGDPEGDTSRPFPTHTHLGADEDILVVEEVAYKLRCTVDFARRIPRSLLPAYRVGRRLLYLRDDVITYLRVSRRLCGDADRRLDEIVAEVLGSSPDSGRERSSHRRTQ